MSGLCFTELFSLFMAIPDCFNYCSFIVSREIGQHFSSNSFLPLQNLFCYFGPLNCHMNFRISLLIFFFFLGSYQQHMEVPSLGVESELQLPSCTTATATLDPSCVFNPHSSRQCWIVNPLSEARDQTGNLVVPSWICFHCATMGTPHLVNF